MLILFACEDKIEKDTNPPTIKITNPTVGSTVWGDLNIEIEVKDDKELKSLEINIDNKPFVIDSSFVGKDTVKLSYELKTKTLSNSSHTMQVAIKDFSDNITSESISFVVDNKSRWYTNLPDGTIGQFVMEKGDEYIVLARSGSTFQTYLLNENGEVVKLIDSYSGLSVAKQDFEKRLIYATKIESGLYFLWGGGKVYRVDNEGNFDLSYNFVLDDEFDSYEALTGTYNGENSVYYDNGWIATDAGPYGTAYKKYKCSYNGKQHASTTLGVFNIDLNQKKVTERLIPCEKLKELEMKTSGFIEMMPEMHLIGAINKDEIIFTNQHGLFYLNLSDNTLLWMDETDFGISPLRFYELEGYTPKHRKNLNNEGHFILYNDEGSKSPAVVIKFDKNNNQFSEVVKIKAENRFEPKYIISGIDIYQITGDSDKIVRYSLQSGSKIGKEYLFREDFGYKYYLDDRGIKMINTSDNGIIFTNWDGEKGKLIVKLDSKLKSPI